MTSRKTSTAGRCWTQGPPAGFLKFGCTAAYSVRNCRIRRFTEVPAKPARTRAHRSTSRFTRSVMLISLSAGSAIHSSIRRRDYCAITDRLPEPSRLGIIGAMSSKPFASRADLAAKEATLEELAPGVYAYTAQGDPNVGCVIGTDAILAIEARATPVMAQRWIDVVRTLSHAAVRRPGADPLPRGARAGRERVRRAAHRRDRATAELIEERGEQDWASEQGRMPRLFEGAESIPGLTRPTDTFEDADDDRPRQPGGGAAVPRPRPYQPATWSCGCRRSASASPGTWSRPGCAVHGRRAHR